MTSFSFRIRKPYFEAIVEGKKTIEYRKASPYWRKRIQNWAADRGLDALFPLTLEKGCVAFKGSFQDDTTAVFICGKRIHRRKIWGITLMHTPSSLSAQGRKDLDSDFCFAFHLGEAIP